MAVVTHSEQDLMIATTNSGLAETTIGPDDECMLDPSGPPMPFTNHALLKEAGEHSSERTLFADGNVIRIDDAVGPPKGALTHPAHPPYVKRASDGGPYRQEARATEGAPNVFVENIEPARFMDPTTQDAANATGIVFDLGRAEELAKMEADRLKRCSLTEDDVECSHGRKLGKSGEIRVLEVVSSPNDPCSVLFEAKRHNAVEPGPPTCKHNDGRHTAWVVHRVPGGFLPERRDDTMKGDVIVLDPSWTSALPIPIVNFKRDGKTDEFKKKDPAIPSKGERERDAQQRANEAFNQNPNRQGGRGRAVGEARQEVGRETQAMRDAAAERKQQFKDAAANKQKGNAIMQGAAQLMNLAQFIRVYFWDSWPIRIDVAAQACTGGLQSQILVFPAEEVEFKLNDRDAEVAGLKLSLKAVTTFAEWLSAVVQLLVRCFVIEIKLLEEPEIELKCQWKELTEDAVRWGRKKQQCGRKMSLRLKLKKIIGLKVELPVPWAKIIDAFFPAAGTGLEYLMAIFGFEVSAGLGMTLDFGVEGSCDKDQMGVFSGKVSLIFDFKFYLYLRIVFRRNVNIEIKALARWNPKVSGFYDDPDAVGFMKLEPGDARLGLTGFVHLSTFWWERSFGGEIWPEFMRYNYNQTDLHPIKMLMALAGKK